MTAQRPETTSGGRSPEAVFTVPEVAARLRCERNTVYRMVNAGELRAVRLGRLVRIPESAVAELLGSAR